MSDPVNHPSHYHSEYWHSACGKTIECIDIVRHMDFNTGNAVKYAWRAGKKGDTIEDLEKAVWYLQDRVSELKRLREAAEALEKKEADQSELLEKLAGPSATFPAPLSGENDLAQPDDAISGGPHEYWVLRVSDWASGNSAWAAFNRDENFLKHERRAEIRDLLLGLLLNLPPQEFDKLAPWVREAANDWAYAETVRGAK